MSNTTVPSAFKFHGYLFASLVALGTDLTVTLATARWLSPVIAASIGFTAGTIVSYLLAQRLAMRSPTQSNTLDFMGYAGIGILTLGQCAGLVYALTDKMGLALILAKGVSIPITFFTGYWLRKKWMLRKMGTC